MTVSVLTLYNGALRLLGQPKLDSVTEATTRRYLLDDAYNDKALDTCLAQAYWNFATRSTQRDYDASVTPDFGLQFAFAKPTDWVRTITVCSDPYFYCPLVDGSYYDEQGYWFADIDQIYVRYVSNDSQYGGDMSLWPATFVRYFEGYLALQIAPNIEQSGDRVERIEKSMARALLDARSKDAMNEGVKFPPRGSWVMARGGSRARSDRGSRNSFTG